jgi:hypothetical protein
MKRQLDRKRGHNCRRDGRPQFSRGSEIDVENCHGEIVGPVAVFIVDIDNAKELFAKIDFRRIVLARTSLDHDLRIERAFEVGVEFLDFVWLHNSSPSGFLKSAGFAPERLPCKGRKHAANMLSTPVPRQNPAIQGTDGQAKRRPQMPAPMI